MNKKSAMLVTAAGILWGCIGIFVRRLSGWGLASMEIVEIRAVFAALFLLPVLLIRDRSLLKIRLKDLWIFLGTSLFSVLFFNFCYFSAIRLLSLSAAAVLLYTAPAFVMVLSFFLFHESFTGRKVAALVLTFLGCLCVSGIGGAGAGAGAGSFSMAGLLAGLGAGIGYAMYSIFGRYAINRGYQSLTITFWTFAIASAGTLLMQPQGSLWTAVFHSPKILGYGAGLGLFSTVLPYLFYTAGLKGMENGTASVIASIEPVTASLIGIILFHETGTWQSWLGVVLVLSGIVLCSMRKSTAEEVPA